MAQIYLDNPSGLVLADPSQAKMKDALLNLTQFRCGSWSTQRQPISKPHMKTKTYGYTFFFGPQPLKRKRETNLWPVPLNNIA